MNSESVPNLCPRCCGAVPADAPQGLCPRCVLARAFAPAETGARSGARLTPPPLEAVAAAFPQFEILELIGVGGMGVVYKARQPKLDRIVALKLLPQSPSTDPAFAERFHREARFLARLTHPYIVSVFDFGESGGFCFLLMEFVDGVNLRQAMQAGRFSPAQALAIVPDICAALQYAHNQGVLHRDIKPENILLDAQGRVKIADFGIAKLVGDPGDPRTDLTLTQSGARLGTPHYMAPEQIEKPADVDHRADIYSLGVVFYELLTGELPLGRFAAPSAKTPLDARVDEIVMRALAKERELRQQSAGEVKSQVETVAANPRASHEEVRPSAPSGLPKLGIGTMITPEKLATFAGQFFLHRTQGQLVLDTRQLTHSCAGVTTVIPLAAIRDLTLGRYSRMMNPAGIDFLSLTYEEAGQTKRVLLSPIENFFGLPSRFNQYVAEWFHAISNAVREVTGRAPGSTPAEKLGAPSGSKAIMGMYVAILIVIAMGIGFATSALNRHPAAGTVGSFLQIWLGPIFASAVGLLFGIRGVYRSVFRAPGDLMVAKSPTSWWRPLKWLLIAFMLAAPLSLFLFLPSKTAPKFENSAEAAMMRVAPNWLTYSLIKSSGSELVVDYRFGSLRQTFLATEGPGLRQTARLLPSAAGTNGAWVYPFEGHIWLRLTPTPSGKTTYVDITTAGAEGSLISKRSELNVRFPGLARGVLQHLPNQGPVGAEQEIMLGLASGVMLKGTLTEFPETAPISGISIATNVVPYFRRSGTNLPALASETSEAANALRLAQKQLAGLRQTVANGQLSAQDPGIQDVEVKVAEAESALSGDPLPGMMARLKRAERRLTANGEVIPTGLDVAEAELKAAEAESARNGNPRAAVVARLKRALEMVMAGKLSGGDLEVAQLEQTKARTAMAETLQQGIANAAERKWLEAWAQYLEEQMKSRIGRTSPAQFGLATRNLKVAEAELFHDPLRAALAQEEYRQGILEIKRRELDAGQVTQGEVDSAEQLLRQAEQERREVEKTNAPAATVIPSMTGTNGPILPGEGGKFAWRPNQPLLQPAASGQAKADSPQLATQPEPAKAPVDYSGVVRFFGSVNRKTELPAKRPTRLTDAIIDLGLGQQALEMTNLKKVKVHHADGSSEMVDVAKVLRENTQDQDMILREGDRVEIHDKTITQFQ